VVQFLGKLGIDELHLVGFDFGGPTATRARASAEIVGATRSPHPSLAASEVEPIEIHDLVPGSDEVAHELLLAVGRCVDLGDSAELRVRAEHEVDGGRRPLRRKVISSREHDERRSGSPRSSPNDLRNKFGSLLELA
jgi:hypothetical protein